MAPETEMKGQIMENQAKNPISPEDSAARGVVAGDAKNQTQYKSSPLRPKTPLLSNASSANGPESSEGMLHQLLMTTEASAQRIQSGRRKWQLLSLILTMVIVPMVLVIGWLSVEMNASRTQRSQIEKGNQSLREQINTANAQIKVVSDEIESQMSRNIELVRENAKLKTQSTAPIAATSATVVKTEQKPVEPSRAVETKAIATTAEILDPGRLEKIRKGTYPSGTTRAELIAVLGEPNRVYISRNYEQLIYFGQKPGRFWFIGNWLVQTTE